MIRSLTTALVASTVAIAPALHAAEIAIESDGPVVELSIYESINVEPDISTVFAGVTSDAPTATEAMRTNAAEMRKVVDRIKALGIDEKDIQTTGISLGARYDWNDELRRQEFRGYQASNSVSVKLRKVDATGAVLDALVAAGATDISGPVFSIENDEAVKAKARENAVKRGQERAEAYARMLGYDGVRVLEINETISGMAGPMDGRMFESLEAAADGEAPVQTGRVSTGVAITVKYEMTEDEAE